MNGINNNCGRCGEYLTNDQSFCSKCGKPVHEKCQRVAFAWKGAHSVSISIGFTVAFFAWQILAFALTFNMPALVAIGLTLLIPGALTWAISMLSSIQRVTDLTPDDKEDSLCAIIVFVGASAIIAIVAAAAFGAEAMYGALFGGSFNIPNLWPLVLLESIGVLGLLVFYKIVDTRVI